MNSKQAQLQLTLIAGHPFNAREESELLATAAGEFAPNCLLVPISSSRIDLPTLTDQVSTEYVALLTGALPPDAYLAAAVRALAADPRLSVVAGGLDGTEREPRGLEMGDALTMRIGRPVVFRRADVVAAVPTVGASTQLGVLEAALLVRLLESGAGGSGLIIDVTGANSSERERQLLLAELVHLVPESYSRHAGAALLRLHQTQTVISGRLADAENALESDILSRVAARRGERDRLAAKVRAQQEQLDLYALRGVTIRRLNQVIATLSQSAPEVFVGRIEQLATELELAQAELELMRGSTSWRLTGPLRRAGDISRGLAGRGR